MPGNDFVPAPVPNLPISELIGEPLKEASDANLDLEEGLTDFENKLGFKSATDGATPLVTNVSKS